MQVAVNPSYFIELFHCWACWCEIICINCFNSPFNRAAVVMCRFTDGKQESVKLFKYTK